MQLELLTAAEESLMLTCWKLEKFYFRDLLDALPDPKPHQNTISTYLKILVEKDFLTTEKEGRIYKYHTSVAFEDYKAAALMHFLKTYYNNDAQQLVTDLKVRDIFQDREKDTSKSAEEKNHIREMLEVLLNGKKKKKKSKKKK